MFENGKGVDKDAERAYMFYTLAKAQGTKSSVDRLEKKFADCEGDCRTRAEASAAAFEPQSACAATNLTGANYCNGHGTAVVNDDTDYCGCSCGAQHTGTYCDALATTTPLPPPASSTAAKPAAPTQQKTGAATGAASTAKRGQASTAPTAAEAPPDDPEKNDDSKKDEGGLLMFIGIGAAAVIFCVVVACVIVHCNNAQERQHNGRLAGGMGAAEVNVRRESRPNMFMVAAAFEPQSHTNGNPLFNESRDSRKGEPAARAKVSRGASTGASTGSSGPRPSTRPPAPLPRRTRTDTMQLTASEEFGGFGADAFGGFDAPVTFDTGAYAVPDLNRASEPPRQREASYLTPVGAGGSTGQASTAPAFGG